MQKILVTDTLFIFPEHEKMMRDAGFEVVRLKGDMNEAELVAAVKGASGYILGGVECITDAVIEAADELKVIAFTGADWANFIPSHALATERGIAITNTPGNTTFAVSEFTLALLLAMLRRIFELGGPGDKSFITTQSLEDVRVGIVGMGRIGERVTQMLLALGVREVWYWNRTRKPELEQQLGIAYAPLEQIVAECDVISNHLSSQAGQIFTKDLLHQGKEGALYINTGAANSFDMDALYDLLAQSKARAAFDIHIVEKDERLASLPLATWYGTNQNAGYNTRASLKMASDITTKSIINILTKGDDPYIVNRG